MAVGASDALGEYLVQRGWEMPASLAEWVSLRRSGEVSIKRRGAPPWGHAERDQGIYQRMAQARREGRAAYMSRAPRRMAGGRQRSGPSESEVLADELKMEARAVEKVFDRLSKPDPRLTGRDN